MSFFIPFVSSCYLCVTVLHVLFSYQQAGCRALSRTEPSKVASGGNGGSVVGEGKVEEKKRGR